MTMALSYGAFLERKAQLGTFDGFAPDQLPDFLFDFQAALVEWALRKGRSAIFADCGLGKTPMHLAWSDAIVRRTNKPVLTLTPIAVGAQTIAEAEKFGIEARRSTDGKVRGAEIVVTNYERLHYFNWQDFAGVVADESSILKAFDGARRGQITDFMRKLPFRLLETATAAPNDYIELGTSSEALGELGYMDVLNRFFKNDLGNSSTGRGYLGKANQWRFKGHAEEPFWQWVSSWARALRRPSDLGFNDARFVLPALQEFEHVVEAATPFVPTSRSGRASRLDEEREEQRHTLRERCEHVARLVANTRQPALVWCNLNDEGDLLESLIPGSVQVSGRDSDDAKEEKLLAFASGQERVLITKPKIGGWGLNFQHCAHVTVFPTHSFEQFYQMVRRCWRFGQKRPVCVDIVTTEGGRGAKANLQRKAAQATRMFDRLVAHMNAAISLDRSTSFTTAEEVPSWL